MTVPLIHALPLWTEVRYKIITNQGHYQGFTSRELCFHVFGKLNVIVMFVGLWLSSQNVTTRKVGQGSYVAQIPEITPQSSRLKLTFRNKVNLF